MADVAGLLHTCSVLALWVGDWMIIGAIDFFFSVRASDCSILTVCEARRGLLDDNLTAVVGAHIRDLLVSNTIFFGWFIGDAFSSFVDLIGFAAVGGRDEMRVITVDGVTTYIGSELGAIFGYLFFCDAIGVIAIDLVDAAVNEVGDRIVLTNGLVLAAAFFRAGGWIALSRLAVIVYLTAVSGGG